MDEDVRVKLTELRAATPSLEGTTAVYREKTTLALVRRQSIRVDERGVHATVVPVPTRGFVSPFCPTDSWTIGACWEYFWYDRRHWNGSYFVWSLFFDGELIGELKALGEQFTAATALSRGGGDW